MKSKSITALNNLERNGVACTSISRSCSSADSLQLTFRRQHKAESVPPGARTDQPSNHREISVPVRFVFEHPTARHVCVGGSFNDWDPSATPLVNLGGGRWLRLVWLPPGRHEYLFVADGVWFPDPHAIARVPNVYGTMNAVVEVLAPSEMGKRGCHRRLLRTSRRIPVNGSRFRIGRLTLASRNHREP